jgi:hypothetical protein
MRSGKGRERRGEGLPRILLAALLVSLPAPWQAAAQRWNTEAAETALKQARELRQKLSADQPVDSNDYLRCIRLYRRVFLSDPHFTGSDDAIYEAATLYQEMAARFNAPEYDREAAQLLRFLIKDYPGSQFRPYAVLRLAAMGPARAGPPAGLPGVAARQQPQSREVPSKPGVEPAPTQSPAAQMAAPAAAIRAIHCTSTPDYTRVTIDLDRRAEYQQQWARNPDRFFCDFSNTWLVLDGSGAVIDVNGRLLRRIRAAQHQPGVVRVVLDLAQGTDCTVSEMSDPFRVVIDVRKIPGPDRAPAVGS